MTESCVEQQLKRIHVWKLWGEPEDKGRELEKRHRGNSEGGVRIETRARKEMRIQVRVRMRAKAKMEMEWVPSIYLIEINK
jgi:hypothetical protein